MVCADADELVELASAALEVDRLFVPAQDLPPVDASVRVSMACPGLSAPLVLAGRSITARDQALARGGVEVALTLSDADRAEASSLVARIREGDPALLARVVRVLIVEDNVFNAQLILDGLSAVGRRAFNGRLLFDVRAAYTVESASSALEDHSIEAVITDFYLAGDERGTTLIRAIRDDPKRSILAVLAMSAGAEDVRRQCMVAGADAFLRKPVRMREIAHTIAELLGIDVRPGVDGSGSSRRIERENRSGSHSGSRKDPR